MEICTDLAESGDFHIQLAMQRRIGNGKDTVGNVGLNVQHDVSLILDMGLQESVLDLRKSEK